MKTVVKMLLALAVVALVVPAMAQDKKPKGERPTAYGEITAVDVTAKTITLSVRTDPKDKNSKAEPKTFTLADDAKISIDGEKDKTLTDVKEFVGKRAAVWEKDSKVVRLSVMTKAREHKKPAEPPKQ